MDAQKRKRWIGDRVDEMFDDRILVARQTKILASERHHCEGRHAAAAPYDAIRLNTGAGDHAFGFNDAFCMAQFDTTGLFRNFLDR